MRKGGGEKVTIHTELHTYMQHRLTNTLQTYHSQQNCQTSDHREMLYSSTSSWQTVADSCGYTPTFPWKWLGLAGPLRCPSRGLAALRLAALCRHNFCTLCATLHTPVPAHPAPWNRHEWICEFNHTWPCLDLHNALRFIRYLSSSVGRELV